jgi:hypothetical protein
MVIWLLFCLPAVAQNLSVYTDALASGFQDYSYNAGQNLSATAQVHTGTKSISWQPHNFGALSFAQPVDNLSSATYSGLTFWLWCSNDCGRALNLSFQRRADAAGVLVKDVLLSNAYPSGVLPAMQWTQISISLDAGPWALAPNTIFDRFNLQDEANNLPASNTMYVDDVQLIARGAAAAVAPLTFTASAMVNGVSGSQFAWIDSLGDPRSAHMATGTGGVNKGGILNQFIYRLPNGSTRTVNPSTCCGAGGFGYIVSHLQNPALAAIDDSPLGPLPGDDLNGTTQTVFAGRHHALHVYSLNYPRWGLNNLNAATKYNMPVKVGWIFATGRNHPLWTVTFDMTQMPADAVTADTRAPYGNMNFDGATNEFGDGDVISGVGWGDLYKFRTTTSPFTFNSSWTWNTPNTIPHNMLWTNAVDSEMGIVLTQPITQQDAGGYFGLNKWNSTSVAGNACPTTPSVMPCDYAWPYQSINYSVGGPNETTQSKRFAWGADFGYIGQTSYPDRATGADRSGYPYQSYSTYIVLDAHSRTPTDTQVSQMEARQLSSVAATIGTVATNGPAGLGRPDNINYQPTGFDPIFDAWTFVVSGNNLTATLTTPAPNNTSFPLFVLRNYSLATEPSQVKVGGITLVPDVDYYASAIPSRNELWLTLHGQFQGTTSLQVIGSTVAGGSTTALGSSANPSNTGQTITFTATVTASAPTGTVTFNDGASALCSSVALTNATSQCSTSSLGVGSHSIVAVYSGDGNNAGSSSAALNQVVAALAAPAVVLNPTSLTFSDQDVQTTSATKTVTLSNTGNATLTLSSIVSNSAVFDVTDNCGGARVAGANCTLFVTFRPTTLGLASSSLAITSNAAGSPHMVTLSGVGIPTGIPVCTLTANPPAVVPHRTSTLSAGCTHVPTSYSWTGAGCAGTSASTCLVSPVNTTAYNVTGTNAAGSSSASATVTVTSRSGALIPILQLLLD